MDEAVLSSADAQCRTLLADPALQVGVADARGGGLIHLFYVGPGGQFGECFDIDVRNGEPVAADAAVFRAPEQADIGPGELAVGSLLRRVGSHAGVFGRYGPGVTRIVIAGVSAEPVVASLGDGVYGAWWPGQLGGVIRAYGADGDLLSERNVLP